MAAATATGGSSWLGWWSRPISQTTVTEGVADDDASSATPTSTTSTTSSSSSSSGSKEKKLSGVKVQAASSDEVAMLKSKCAELERLLQQALKERATAVDATSSSSSRPPAATGRSRKGPPALHELHDLKIHVLPVDMELPQPPAEPSVDGARDFYDKLSQSLHLPPPSLTRPIKSAAAPSSMYDEKEGKGERKDNNDESKMEEQIEGAASSSSAQQEEGEIDDVEGRPTTKRVVTGIGEIASTSTQSVIVTAPPGEDESPDSGAVQHVGVVDLANVEWWTMVEKIKDEEEDIYVNVESGDEGETTEINTAEDDDDENATTAKSTLGGTYELVKEEDLCVALADYVALSMARYPQAKQLSAREMQDMLDATFGQLKEPSTVGKLWNWGQFAYTTYGYGSWLYKLYKDPQLVKLVATGVWKAAKWMIVLVV